MNRRRFLSAAVVSSVALAARAASLDHKWRVGVIGHTGHGDYGHGLDTVWLQLPEAEIVAVADADARGLVKAQAKLKVARGFADYRQMLAAVKPEIVAIGPRHLGEHRDMALAAVGAGARAIFIEKPFCRTLAEADEIVAGCEEHKVKLAVAHRNRYHPVLQAIDRMLKENVIGRLLEMRGRGKEDTRGGALDLWVLGSHVFNLMHYFGGKPLACSAALLQAGRPVTSADVKEGDEGVGLIGGNEVHARFEMERGVPAFFDSIQNAGKREASFGLQLVGNQGIIDLRVDREPLAHLVPGNPFQPAKEPRPWIPISSAGAGQPEPIADLARQISSHARAAQDLMAAVREDRQPLCSAQDGRLTVEMISAVFESHRLNGRRITFPLQTRHNPLALL